MRSLAVLALVAAVTPLASAQPTDEKLNVVFLLADDMGWTGPASFGGDLHETPNIDRLVREGMKFTQAYAACAVCSPSRAAILTGKYPARLHTTDWIPGHKIARKVRIPQWKPYLDHAEITIAEVLKKAGYRTASVGKWHLGSESHYPETHGFDVNVAGTHHHSPPRGHGYFLPNPLFPNAKKGRFLTDRLTDEAIRLIEKWKDGPFFLYFPYHAVHDPVMGKPAYKEHYRRKHQPGMKQFKPSYAAMTQSIDDSVGRILETLEELGLEDRTVIFFTSDNGGQLDHTTNDPLRDGKASCYDGGVRVPLVIRWPGVTRPGSVSRELVTGVDYYPTIVDILGLKKALAGRTDLDGRSLVPVLRDPSTRLEPRALYWHYPHYNPQRLTRPYGAMRDGDWRFLIHYEDMDIEVYNLKNDIGERTNLAGSMPEKTGELREKFFKWIESVDAQMPLPNPGYEPGRGR